MAKVGRPSKFDPVKCEQAEKLCKLGAKDKELADFFEVSEATLNNWKNQHPEFLEALKRGKEQADAQIAGSLYHRANGYSHPDVHVSNYQGQVTLTPIIKHYPPDPTSMIFWLKNRRPDLWRDRIEHTGKDGGPIQSVDVTDEELAKWLAFEAAGKVIAQAKRGAKTNERA